MNYCSLKCSKELLVTQETLDKNEVAYGASAQVNDRVQITAIISENCFYIQQYGFNRGFIHTDIQKFGKIAPQLEMLPDINDLVLARFGDEFYLQEFFKCLMTSRTQSLLSSLTAATLAACI